MHQFRRRFSKVLPEADAPKFDGWCRLPTELLILIASFVPDRRDIARLCVASKQFRGVYTPELYRTISVDTCTTKAIIPLQFSLYHTLRTLQFSHFVTDLRLCLRRTMICGRWNHQRSLLRTFRPCTCAKYEKALGQAILTLHNLQSLTIKCTLCEEKHNHGYLFDMQTSLQLFAFRCFRSHTGFKESMLQIPFMSHVTVLDLECYESNSHQPPDDILLTRDSTFAPQLRAICLDGTSFANKILSTRHIERICVDSFTRRILSSKLPFLHDNIVESPGELTHLLLIDLLQWLPLAMKRDPEPYLNLRFIGTITGLNIYDIGAFKEMECLSSLKNLETIEMNRFRLSTEPGSFKVDPDSNLHPAPWFFGVLEHKHPSLRRILLMFRKSDSLTRIGEGWLWEKSEKWGRRRVPYLEYWDLLCNKLGGAYLPDDYPDKTLIPTSP